MNLAIGAQPDMARVRAAVKKYKALPTVSTAKWRDPSIPDRNSRIPYVGKHTAFGKMKTLKVWAAEYGMKYGTLKSRFKLTNDLEASLTKPVRAV